MKLSRTIIGLAVVGLFQVSLAIADIPPIPKDLPEGKNWGDMKDLKVTVDPTKDISILRIPRSVLGAADGELREKKNTKPSAWSPTTTRSLAAALAMSLGIGGVFLARKKRSTAVAVALVAATVVGTLGVEAWGNAPAPQPPAEAPVAVASLPQDFRGNVVVEIVDGAGVVSLTIGTKPLPTREPRFGPRVTPPPTPPSDVKKEAK